MSYIVIPLTDERSISYSKRSIDKPLALVLGYPSEFINYLYVVLNLLII